MSWAPTRVKFESMRFSILQALGDFDRAFALARERADIYPSYSNLATVAMLHFDRGDLQKAEGEFVAALRAFRSVSPLELSWLLFEWGRIYEQADQWSRARYLYEIAHARLPRYAEVAGHLATMLAVAGDVDRARSLLGDLITDTDDPEYAGMLAEIHHEQGDRARADELVARATTGYGELLERFPEAFADHAARYFLGVGDNPTRAVELAKTKLGCSPDRDILRAGTGSHAAGRRCQAGVRHGPLGGRAPLPVQTGVVPGLAGI